MIKQVNVLYVALRADLTGDGASIYALNNILAFSSHALVDTILLDDTQTAEGKNRLKKACHTVIHVGGSKQRKLTTWVHLFIRGHNIFQDEPLLQRAVIKQVQTKQYDIVVTELYTAYLSDAIKKVSPKSSWVLCQHNYEYANHWEYVQYSNKGPIKKKLYALLNRRYQAVECHYIKAADAVIAISGQDKILFDAMRRDKSTFVMSPAGMYAPEKSEIPSTCKKLLFLGSMDWYPNIEGVLQFIQQVFYNLVAVDATYHLYVVGKNPPARLLRQASSHITITGKVDDVNTYIRDCDLMIVPNSLGGGVKIKVMEGLVKGIPLLISTHSSVGYEGIVDFFISKNMQGFEARIKSYSNEYQKYQDALLSAQQKLSMRIQQNARTAALIIQKLSNTR